MNHIIGRRSVLIALLALGIAVAAMTLAAPAVLGGSSHPLDGTKLSPTWPPCTSCEYCKTKGSGCPRAGYTSNT